MVFNFPNFQVDLNEFSVLIRKDVPQAHIVPHHCCEDNPQSEPYASKTPFGRCVVGPTNRKEDDSKPVAHSAFEFDWAEDKSAMQLHQEVERFGFLSRTDLAMMVTVPTVLKTIRRWKYWKGQEG